MKKEITKDNLKNDKGKKKHGFLHYFLSGLIYAVCFAILGVSVCNFADQKSGYKFLPNHSAVIISESMSRVNPANYSYLEPDCKHIMKNDMIFTTNYKSFDDVKTMDVAVYIGQDGILVCHRVIDKYVQGDEQFIVTRGDANATSDTPVNFKHIRGKVINVIPKVGNVISFFQSLYFIMALCFSLFFILLGTFIFNLKSDKKSKVQQVEGDKTPTESEIEKAS